MGAAVALSGLRRPPGSTPAERSIAMKKWPSLVAGGIALILGAAGLALSPAAQADTLPSSDAVFQDWNNAFLYQGGGDTYYLDTLKSQSTTRARMWIAALDIQVAQDEYERTRTPADRQLVSQLVTTYIKDEGSTWASWDSWNDDIAWDDIAVLRGYQDTGNTDWLSTAIDQWNATYNRGWTGDGGGGIWEDMGSTYSKCSLSNNPMVSTAVSLYQITGDGTYLTKAEAIYDWVRKNLVNTSSGVVNECIAFPNGVNGSTTLQASDNAYNAGVFHRGRRQPVPGHREQPVPRRRAAHRRPLPQHRPGGREQPDQKGSSYQYWLFKGISDFCTDANLCSRYDAYLRSNAAQAWSERNSAGLTWNDWTKPTNDPNPDAFEMNGMVGLFQVLPTTAASPFSGDYELLNAGSKLSVGVQGDSTANSAPVVQNTDTGDTSASWSFVQESNGYYEIKNSRSGQLLNVSSTSTGALGGQVVQWPAGGLTAGQRPVDTRAQNSDGSVVVLQPQQPARPGRHRHEYGGRHPVRAVDAERRRRAAVHPGLAQHRHRASRRWRRCRRRDVGCGGEVPGPQRRQHHQRHRGAALVLQRRNSTVMDDDVGRRPAELRQVPGRHRLRHEERHPDGDLGLQRWFEPGVAALRRGLPQPGVRPLPGRPGRLRHRRHRARAVGLQRHRRPDLVPPRRLTRPNPSRDHAILPAEPVGRIAWSPLNPVIMHIRTLCGFGGPCERA